LRPPTAHRPRPHHTHTQKHWEMSMWASCMSECWYAYVHSTCVPGMLTCVPIDVCTSTPAHTHRTLNTEHRTLSTEHWTPNTEQWTTNTTTFTRCHGQLQLSCSWIANGEQNYAKYRTHRYTLDPPLPHSYPYPCPSGAHLNTQLRILMRPAIGASTRCVT